VTVAARKIRLIMELRAAGVADTRVLAAIERVPREIFVPETFQDRSYENTALPIGLGQTISQPQVVGMMTQALELGDRMKVLEIGTGSGYQTAVLAKLARRVYTIERHRPLLRAAEQRLHALRVGNVTAMAGDGYQGWPDHAPFERIIVTAAPGAPPPALVAQLADGGIMVLPIAHGPLDQRVMRIRRRGDELVQEELGQHRFVPLVAGIAAEAPLTAAAEES
jgi:protein-L-isoaspartate(D-aspartate) O-methyltransferase